MAGVEGLARDRKAELAVSGGVAKLGAGEVSIGGPRAKGGESAGTRRGGSSVGGAEALEGFGGALGDLKTHGPLCGEGKGVGALGDA